MRLRIMWFHVDMRLCAFIFRIRMIFVRFHANMHLYTSIYFPNPHSAFKCYIDHITKYIIFPQIFGYPHKPHTVFVIFPFGICFFFYGKKIHMTGSIIYPSTTFHHYWSPFHSTLLASLVWPRAYTTVLSPNGDSCQQIMTVGDAVTIDHIANIPQNWRQVWQLNSPSFLQLGKYFLLPGLSGEVSMRLSLPPLPLPGDSEESVLAQLFRGILNNPTILNNPQQSSTIQQS